MFDPSPAHITILLIVLVVLFGAARLPKAAKSLGQSMHIFKKEVQGLTSDGDSTAATPVTVTSLPAAAPAVDPTHQQLSDLQRQVEELQRQSAGSGNGQAGQTQTGQPL